VSADFSRVAAHLADRLIAHAMCPPPVLRRQPAETPRIRHVRRLIDFGYFDRPDGSLNRAAAAAALDLASPDPIESETPPVRLTILGFDVAEPAERIHALVFPSPLDGQAADALVARARTVTMDRVEDQPEGIPPGAQPTRILPRRQTVCTIELPLVETVTLRQMDLRDPLEAITKALMDETGAIRHEAAQQAHVALQALVDWATERTNNQ